MLDEFHSDHESDSGQDPEVTLTLEEVVVNSASEYLLTFILRTQLTDSFIYNFKHSTGLIISIVNEPPELKNGDRLQVIVNGGGLFKVFVAWPKSKENIFQQGFAVIYNDFVPKFREVMLNAVSKHTTVAPEVIFTATKINSLGKKMQRALVISINGIRNFRENGTCSSITYWSRIKGAIDKLDHTVHILQNDGKLRVYESPLSEFLALCLRTYHKRATARSSRFKMFVESNGK